MTTVSTRPFPWRSPLFGGAVALLLAAAAIGSVVFVVGRGGSRQEAVATRGAQVMPFDLARTTHSFTDLPDGGDEVIVADDPADTEQIALIRAHLAEEARKFAAGDFSDPAAIHGADMPGLKQLQAGASKIEFRYRDLPDGAAITYRTADSALVGALHSWFAAQRSDHGAAQMSH